MGSGVWVYNLCGGTEFHGTTNADCFQGFHLVNAKLPTQGIFTTAWYAWQNQWSSTPQNDIVGTTYMLLSLAWWFDPSCSPICEPFAGTLTNYVTAQPTTSGNHLTDCVPPTPAPREEKRDEEFGAAVMDTAQYNGFPEENKYHDKEYFFRKANEDSSLLTLGLPNDTVYVNEYDSLAGTNIGALQQVEEYFKDENYSLASSLNQGVN